MTSVSGSGACARTDAQIGNLLFMSERYTEAKPYLKTGLWQRDHVAMLGVCCIKRATSAPCETHLTSASASTRRSRVYSTPAAWCLLNAEDGRKSEDRRRRPRGAQSRARRHGQGRQPAQPRRRPQREANEHDRLWSAVVYVPTGSDEDAPPAGSRPLAARSQGRRHRSRLQNADLKPQRPTEQDAEIMVAVTAERYDGLSEILQALEHRAAVVATTGRTGAAVETLTAGPAQRPHRGSSRNGCRRLDPAPP